MHQFQEKMSVLNTNDDQVECPLCMEPLEVDDLNFYPCTCEYQICRFCWHRIRTDENGLCPACRKPYPENPANFKPLTQEELQRIKSEKKQKDLQRKQKLTENRKHLSNVRVVQKNLVFVVGLSMRLADQEILKKHEYFGKFGKIVKVVTNHSTSYAGSQGPSASAYVTYARPEDALRAIQAVNNIHVDGRTLKASLGTTKYCSNFLKNQSCPKPDCMYLHELGDEAASFTKEEMQQGKHQEYERKLHEQLSAGLNAPTLEKPKENRKKILVPEENKSYSALSVVKPSQNGNTSPPINPHSPSSSSLSSDPSDKQTPSSTPPPPCYSIDQNCGSVGSVLKIHNSVFGKCDNENSYFSHNSLNFQPHRLPTNIDVNRQITGHVGMNCHLAAQTPGWLKDDSSPIPDTLPTVHPNTDWQAAFGFPSSSAGLDLSSSSKSDDDLGFDPFVETSKALAEMIESESQPQSISDRKGSHQCSSSKPRLGVPPGFGPIPTINSVMSNVDHRMNGTDILGNKVMGLLNQRNGLSLSNGLLSNGMANGSHAASHNGLPNGLSNGLANGLSGGMTNGLSGGMTNGLSNGLLRQQHYSELSNYGPHHYNNRLKDIVKNDAAFNFKDWHQNLRTLFPKVNITFDSIPPPPQLSPSPPTYQSNSQLLGPREGWSQSDWSVIDPAIVSATNHTDTAHWIKSLGQISDSGSLHSYSMSPNYTKMCNGRTWYNSLATPPPGFPSTVQNHPRLSENLNNL